jgi:hypothetical protein
MMSLRVGSTKSTGIKLLMEIFDLFPKSMYKTSTYFEILDYNRHSNFIKTCGIVSKFYT